MSTQSASEKFMKAPMVSAIIVNYNGRQWLQRCLDSLIGQTYKELEIIVVDNASTDDSIDYIRTHYPQVVLVLSDDNSGFANGVNQGIASARGQDILLFNTDAWVEYDFVEKLNQERRDRQLDLIAPNENNYENTIHQRFSTTLDVIGYPARRPPVRDSLYLQGVCMLFSAELYRETGGLDNDYFMYYEETDWCWRLQLFGKHIAYSNSLFIHHAGSGTTGKNINRNAFLWRNQNCLQTLLKNLRWYNLVWILPLYLVQNIIDCVGLVLVGKFDIATTYPSGLQFNIKLLPKTLEKRRHIQQRRIKKEREILSLLYFGSGRIQHLIRKRGTT